MADSRSSMTVAIRSLVVVALFLGGCARGPFARKPAAPSGPTAADLYLEGMNAAREGDREAAIRSLEQSVRLSPNFAMAHSALGDLYKSSGNYDAAATQYETVTRLDAYTA